MDETRTVKHLLQGFCTHDEGTSAYFIPSFEDKDNLGSDFIMDLVIFEITETKKRGKKLHEGYQGRITCDTLQNQATPDGEDPEVLKEQLMKAVYHRDGFYADISSCTTSSTFVEFYKKEDEDSPKRVCRAPLIRVDIAIPAGQVVEATLLSLERASDTCLATKSLTVDLDDQQKELQKKLNELIVEKNRMEDRMLRAFTVAMNAQKEGYRKLHKKYLSLLERQKKTDGISDEITQDQQTAITVDDDSESHSEYDMETDVEESTPNTDETRKKRRKVHRIIDDSGSESEGFEDRRKTDVVKNLFTESATQKPDTSTASKHAHTVEENDGDTDFGESSQEMYVPQAKRPTTYKSPFKASNTADDGITPKKTKDAENERKESDGEEAATTKKPVDNSHPSRSTRSKTSNSLLSSIFPDSQ